MLQTGISVSTCAFTFILVASRWVCDVANWSFALNGNWNGKVGCQWWFACTPATHIQEAQTHEQTTTLHIQELGRQMKE